jgi:hypothetical protein
MLRERRVVGVIFVARTEPGLVADTQIDLLKVEVVATDGDGEDDTDVQRVC